jgi:hypothetical protein
VSLGALLLLGSATSADAATGPRSGRYAGKTSQRLPFVLYLGQTHKGELGRPVVYTGIEGNLRARLREVATVKVRVACTGVAGGRWNEIIPVRVLARRRNRSFSDSGDLTVRRGRFRYSPLDLLPRRLETYDERLRGRIAGGKAAGVIELRVKKFAEEPLVSGEVAFASCKSGRVKWKARLARRSRRGGTPRVGPAPPPAPRRVRDDSYLTDLLGGARTGGGGMVVSQDQGGGSFTGYAFKSGGGLLYCHRAADGSRDYRSGTWTVLAGYLWSWPSDEAGHAEGQLRLSLPGSAVEADVSTVGRTITLSPKGGQLGSASGSWQPDVPDCAQLEQ